MPGINHFAEPRYIPYIVYAYVKNRLIFRGFVEVVNIVAEGKITIYNRNLYFSTPHKKEQVILDNP